MYSPVRDTVPPEAGGPGPREEVLDGKALKDFGGVLAVARLLRCCTSRESQRNLLAVLLDAACQGGANSGRDDHLRYAHGLGTMSLPGARLM